MAGLPVTAPRARGAGFTLLELLVVIVVAAVLAALALPSFNDLILNNRRTSLVNELVGTLALARGEAVKRGQRVIVCGADDADGDQQVEDSELACRADWRDGWFVFSDLDRDGVLDNDLDGSPEPGEDAILARFANPYATTITSNVTTFAINPFNTASTDGTVVFCDRRGAAKARAVIVASTGRARTSDTKADGSALTCP